MLELIRRSRGLWVAAVVLALSAGVALAASGPANLHPFLTGPNGADATDATETAETAEPTEAPESEAPEASEAPDGSETRDTSGASTDAHGALVSAAAQMRTPAGFSNHGAFVSCVAHMKNVTLATINWSTVTPTSCEAAEPGKPASH